MLTCQILLIRLHSIAFESLSSSLPTHIHVIVTTYPLAPSQSTCQASRAFLAFHLAQQTENLLTHRRASQPLLGLSLRQFPHPHFLSDIRKTNSPDNTDTCNNSNSQLARSLSPASPAQEDTSGSLPQGASELLEHDVLTSLLQTVSSASPWL